MFVLRHALQKLTGLTLFKTIKIGLLWSACFLGFHLKSDSDEALGNIFQVTASKMVLANTVFLILFG